jgi:hypothetical protein
MCEIDHHLISAGISARASGIADPKTRQFSDLRISSKQSKSINRESDAG